MVEKTITLSSTNTTDVVKVHGNFISFVCWGDDYFEIGFNQQKTHDTEIDHFRVIPFFSFGYGKIDCLSKVILYGKFEEIHFKRVNDCTIYFTSSELPENLDLLKLIYSGD